MSPRNELIPSSTLPMLLFITAGILAMATSLQAAEEREPYEDGTIVQITGVVADIAGDPIAGVTVALEGSRRSTYWATLEKRKEHPATITTFTNENGEYTLNWKWHHYYNNFELRAVIPVRTAGGNDHLQTLTGLLLNERILTGSPVYVPLTVRDTGFLTSFRDFLASLDTDEKRDTYDRLGKPDKVESVRLQDGEEVSWWYFGIGKTFRFRNGGVTEVVEFEPVPPIGD